MHLEVIARQPASVSHSAPLLFVHGAWHGAALDAILFNLPRPAKVKTPLLVLDAADDAIFPPHEVQATARAYNTTAEIFPDMAHDMMLEAGWQKVADRILAWLNERGL